MNSNTVYLYCQPRTENTASSDQYRTLARKALSRLEFPLPETGTILLKANATLSGKALSNHIANHLHASE